MPKKRRKLNGFGFRDAKSFIKLDHGLLNTESWKYLSPDGTKVLLDIWKRHNGINNGDISYSQREAYRCLSAGCGQRISMRRAKKALDELQEKGFAAVTRASSFNLKTKRARTWEITAERRGDNPPNKAFKAWQSTTGKQNTDTATVSDGYHGGICKAPKASLK